MRERRASQRYGLKLSIAFRSALELQQNERFVGETLNISTGGMYFTTPRPLVFKKLIDFSLTFPGLAQGANVLVTGRARVLRVVQNYETTSKPAEVAVITEEYHIIEPGAST